jgi:hypothetical protein
VNYFMTEEHEIKEFLNEVLNNVYERQSDDFSMKSSVLSIREYPTLVKILWV